MRLVTCPCATSGEGPVLTWNGDGAMEAGREEEGRESREEASMSSKTGVGRAAGRDATMDIGCR